MSMINKNISNIEHYSSLGVIYDKTPVISTRINLPQNDPYIIIYHGDYISYSASNWTRGITYKIYDVNNKINGTRWDFSRLVMITANPTGYMIINSNNVIEGYYHKYTRMFLTNNGHSAGYYYYSAARNHKNSMTIPSLTSGPSNHIQYFGQNRCGICNKFAIYKLKRSLTLTETDDLMTSYIDTFPDDLSDSSQVTPWFIETLENYQ